MPVGHRTFFVLCRRRRCGRANECVCGGSNATKHLSASSNALPTAWTGRMDEIWRRDSTARRRRAGQRRPAGSVRRGRDQWRGETYLANERGWPMVVLVQSWRRGAALVGGCRKQGWPPGNFSQFPATTLWFTAGNSSPARAAIGPNGLIWADQFCPDSQWVEMWPAFWRSSP